MRLPKTSSAVVSKKSDVNFLFLKSSLSSSSSSEIDSNAFSINRPNFN